MSTLSPTDVSGISNTISDNTNSISSFTSTTPEKFTSNITNTVSSAVGDPIGGVLNKTLSKIADVSTLAESKVDDLTKELNNYQSKNGRVQIIGNKIVITVSSKDAAKGESEQKAITQRVNSIKNTLLTLNTTINTLNTISNSISIIQKLLDAQEVLLTANPVTKAAFTVFKQAIKIVFLKDMLKSYGGVISDQLTKSKQSLNQLTQKFLNLQVSLNIQDESNKGNNISEQEAQSNISQDLLGPENVDSQSINWESYNAKVYVLKVEKLDTNQLVGRAYDQETGLLAAQTSPSYIANSEDLFSEIKSIINA